VYSLISGFKKCGHGDDLFINILPGTRDKYESMTDLNGIHVHEDLWQKRFKENYCNSILLQIQLGILRRIGFRRSVEGLFELPRDQWIKACEGETDVVLYPFHKGIRIRYANKPVVIVMHDLRDLEQDPVNFKPFYLDQIRRCKAIVTSWPHPFQLLKQFFPEYVEKFHMIPFLPEPIPPDEDTRRSSVPRLLVYPASNGVDKNHDNLIKALGILKANGSELVSVVCPGFQSQDRARTLNKLIIDNHVEDWISFIGFVPRSHVRWLYMICSGVVSTTKYEAFSGAVFEGFIYGKPVACSRIPSLTCMIDSMNVNVKYFDPDDPVDIASSIKEIIDNPLPYIDGSLAARKKISDITQEKTAIKYREVLECAIKK